MIICLLPFYFVFAAELFSDVQPFVQSALDGYNVSIFAYGQTRSGKTHTMVCLSLSPLLACSLAYSFVLFPKLMFAWIVYVKKKGNLEFH